MNMTAMITILCLCSSGITASGIGLSKLDNNAKTWSFALLIVFIVLMSAGGMYFVAKSPY